MMMCPGILIGLISFWSGMADESIESGDLSVGFDSLFFCRVLIV